MISEWKEVPLSLLYDFRSGLSKPRSEFGFGHAFLSFKDVFYNFFVPDKLRELVNSTEQERQSCSIKRGDVFLTRTSETMEDLGMSCVALKDYDSATFNGFTKRLRPKTNTNIVPEYAGYFFRSPKFRHEVTAMSSLSTRASLNNEMLRKLKMVLPPYEEQATIGFLLKSFDDKIELNRKMNQTLEAIARAIFKSWFLDFDPVYVKAEGLKNIFCETDMLDLFPDSFFISELVSFPRGWEHATIGDICERVLDKVSVASEWADEALIDLRRMPKKSIALTDWGLGAELATSVTKFKTHDTLFGAIRPYFHKVGIAPMNGVTNVSVFVIRTKSSAEWPYIATLCSLPTTVEYATMVSKGTKMPVVAWKDFKAYKIVLPPSKLRMAYCEKVKPYYRQIINNIFQLRTVSSIRNTLLPKFLSGEIRIKDAEKLVEDFA